MSNTKSKKTQRDLHTEDSGLDGESRARGDGGRIAAVEKVLAELKRQHMHYHDQLTGAHYAPLGPDTRHNWDGRRYAFEQAANILEKALGP